MYKNNPYVMYLGLSQFGIGDSIFFFFNRKPVLQSGGKEFEKHEHLLDQRCNRAALWEV